MTDKETRWCAGCQMEVPISDFTKDKNYTGGLDKYCKSCKSKINKSNYDNSKVADNSITLARHNTIVEQLSKEYRAEILRLTEELRAYKRLTPNTVQVI